jgi:hypothetical protein
MSELDPGLIPGGGPYTPPMQTSRMALISFFSALLCIPGISIILGLFALRQINSTNTLEGANLAWMGILGGLVNLLGLGVAGQHYVQAQRRIDAPAKAFMAAWMKSEADGEAAAAPGLSPLMHRGKGDAIRTVMAARLGAFRDVGPRTHFGYKPSLHGEQIDGDYPLYFASGAPCTAHLEFTEHDGRMRVVGFTLDSPVLADLVAQGNNSLRGGATPDLRDYSDPGDAQSRVKSFKQ